MPRDPCSELAKSITELAMHLGADPKVKTLADVTEAMKVHVPEITREEIISSITEATSGHRTARSEIGTKLSRLKLEARNDVRLRQAAKNYEAALKSGTLPEKAARVPGEKSPEIASLEAARDELQKAIAQSDPALKARYEKQIGELTDRLENGVFTPDEPSTDVLRSKQIERLAYERDKLRTELRHQINKLRPMTSWGKAISVKDAVRQLVVGGDFGVIFRQGGFNALSHPVQHLRAIGDLARSVKDPIRARQIMQSIEDSPWRPLAERAGLKLSQVENIYDGHKFQEEGYGSILNRVAPARAIERGNQVMLNKIRFDRFTAMCETVARNGEPTLAEAQAIARFANESSGAASKGGAEALMKVAGHAMFSPSYQVSRLQTLAGHSAWGGSWRTRTAIAKEYGRAVIGGAVMVTIASQLGFRVGSDPRSSDFGKLILPNGKRYDPWGGLSQWITLGGRMVTGESVSMAGKLSPLSGPKARRTRLDVLETFARGKLDPISGIVTDKLSNSKNVIGEKLDFEDIPQRLALPISYVDVYKSLRDDGVPGAVIDSVMELSGWGVQSPPANRGH